MGNINLYLKFSVLALLISVLLSFRILKHQQSPKQDIIGKYKSADDTNWVWEFKSDGKLYDYYAGKHNGIYFFSIETTSPQCGFEVDEGPLFKYLIRKKIDDPTLSFCYEIYSSGDNSIQLRLLGSNNFFNFEKTN
jgi:hypothetical protein